MSSYSVSNNYSGELGRIRKSLSGNLNFIYSKNTTTPGTSVKLTDDVPIEINYEEDGFKIQSVTMMIRKTDKSSQSNVAPTDESGIY